MLHKCEKLTPWTLYGPAIESCFEGDGKEVRNDGTVKLQVGTFWVTNLEYTSQVNFCPYCGVKALVQCPDLTNWEECGED
jgi:hypothetical protein